MKYMVLECYFSYAVVLDENGRFLKVANMNYKVGQTVTNIIEMQDIEKNTVIEKNKHKRWIYSIAAIAACLAIIFTSIFNYQQTQLQRYASVYVAINPEVRIDVNYKDIVVGLDALNEDGEQLIADYDYKKKKMEFVIDELVDRAIEMGFLYEGGEITIGLDAENTEWVTINKDTLEKHLNEYLKEKVTVTIKVEDINAPSYEISIPIENVEEDNNTEISPIYTEGESDYDDDSDDEVIVPNYSDGQSNYNESIDDGQSDYSDAEVIDDSAYGD